MRLKASAVTSLRRDRTGYDISHCFLRRNVVKTTTYGLGQNYHVLGIRDLRLSQNRSLLGGREEGQG